MGVATEAITFSPAKHIVSQKFRWVRRNTRFPASSAAYACTIVTSAFSGVWYEPYIKAEWVRPGTHLSCIGADLSGKEEVDFELFRAAKVFGDDEGQCLSVGECEIPHKKGILSGLLGEIGGVMAGVVPGRTSQEDITIFDSTGIALQDLASAASILGVADQAGVGVQVDL